MIGLLRGRRAGMRAARLLAVSLVLAPVAASGKAAAGEALVAVAANFTEALESLNPPFEAASGHRLTISSGSTGKLYAQIVNGAPFDILLSADEQTPQKLEAAGLAVAGSRFTYAIGRLAVWSADPQRIRGDGAAALRAADFRRLAIANPRLAPYGAAAQQTLEALGLWDRLQDRVVQGENIGQVFAMTSTGNAELGLVALSHVLSPRNRQKGSRWEVPPEVYRPIKQDAVLLARAKDNAAATAFLAYLKSAETRRRIAAFGYGAD